MKSEKPQNTIIRVPLSNGNYATISNIILFNEKLTPEAKLLLQILLNNTSEWEINLEFYSKKFGWGKEKQAAIINNLKENGFLTVKKYSNGYSNGFNNVYMISEYGNLVRKVDSGEESTSIDQPELMEPSINPVEINNHEITTDEMDEVFVKELVAFISSLTEGLDLDEGYIQKIYEFYSKEVGKGTLTSANLDKSKLREALLKSIAKNRQVSIGNYIDSNLSVGTIHQRKCIKDKVLGWCMEKILNGDKVDDKEMKNRLLLTKTSILSAHKQYNSTYQD